MTRIQVCIPDVDRVLRRLGWIDADRNFDRAPSTHHDGQGDCWLRHWLDDDSSNQRQLNAHGRQCVKHLVEAGWTVRDSWPRSWGESTTKWLGRRLFVGQASLFSPATQHHALLSSRIGRHGSAQPDWPRWIDATLQHIRQHRGQLLVAPGTTLAELVTQFASSARLPITIARWTQQDDIEAWLSGVLDSICHTIDAMNHPARNELLLSPMLEPADDRFCDLPLQDRVSIGLADRAWLLSLRTGGTLEKLIQERLTDPMFPTASVFVRLSHPSRTSEYDQRSTSLGKPAKDNRWLERGAVGWLVASRTFSGAGPLRHCQANGSKCATLQQIVAPFPRVWQEVHPDDEWPYLVHCTRGFAGPLPAESEQSFRQRVWVHPESVVWRPLETLSYLCQEGRLRGTASMTRTAERCVSFSAVPLVPLLTRRTFRSHLGRWDWEPYGLLIRRDALQAIGARHVIYGDESDYACLHSHQQPFFQPQQRKGEQQHEWSEEREWRVLGDVDLRMLPNNSVIAFVRSQREARQFARYCNWPVLWLEE